MKLAFSCRRLFRGTLTLLLPGAFTSALLFAQAPATPSTPNVPSTQVGPQTQVPPTASQRPPATTTPQTYSTEQIQAGQPIFASRCGFCHGRDAAGGESGPDLTRSPLVAEDLRGDKIIPVIRSGRVDKGMPGFSLENPDLDAIVAFIHDQKARADAQEGGRRTVDPTDLQSGDADAGRRYFHGAGGCVRCHSPNGDFAGIANRLEGLTLLQRMLYPSGGGPGSQPSRSPATVTVTTRSGQTTKGTLAYRDEFTIALIDVSGWYRSWPVSLVTFTVDNPLDSHAAQLGKYTDDDMHNVLAYLQTLR
jgi:cytochrome c oxidase cbb3-type subunit 3